MPWFRVDDGFYSSRKVTQIPRSQRWSAIGLWTIAGTWSAKELTDGFVPDYQLDELGGLAADAESLVRVGLWDAVDGGFQFANWGEYQPTKKEVEESRKKEAERKRKWRESRDQSRGTKPGRDAGQSAESEHPDPTRPDPTRPGGLTPFCPLHPGGTRQKCGPCGDARRAFDLAQKTVRDKPTIVGIVTEPDCPKHPHRPLRGCDRCAEEAAA